MQKLIRITTVPLSLEKLLEGQLNFMSQFYQVTAVSSDHDRLKKIGKNNGVKVFPLQLTRAITPLIDLRAVYKLYKFLRKEKPLIVHTHTPKAGIVGMIAAKMANVPIRLHTVAGLPLLETSGIKRKVLNQVEKITYSLATNVYPNSFGLKHLILKEEFVKNEKLKVLGKGSSNGIDTEFFDPSLFTVKQRANFKNKLKIPDSHFVFIFIGRLVSEKGINELITAFEKMADEIKEISLLLVGPFEEELDPLSETTLHSISFNPNIISVGYQVDVRPYLSISDVLVFPSYREGFPNVVMQAGAMNIPSIVTNINGCNEIISEGENGIIIPVKNDDAIYQAMKRIKINPELRNLMRDNSRKNITENYERKEYWNLLLEEYQNLEVNYLNNS